MKKISLAFVLIAAIGFGCNNSKTQNKALKQATLQNGTWRGVITRPDGIQIPFNFDVKDSGTIMVLRNSNQQLEGDAIHYKGDSVLINTKFFLSEFRIKIQKDSSLKGQWIEHFPGPDPVYAFSATPNTKYRIKKNPKPEKANISGRWRTYFINPKTNDSLLAIGLFNQNGNIVTGTEVAHFHHDRYLEGVVSDDNIIITCMDAAHRVKIAGKIVSDSLMTGIYYSGTTGKKNWVAIKDSTVKLKNAMQITTYKPGEQHLKFRFPDLKGDTVSINDSEYKNKVVIVQLFGSWCINCKEETMFLVNWYKKNKDRGVRIIGICAERSADYKEAVQSAMTFKKGLDIPYPMLITGVALNDLQWAEKVLPQLKNFDSFPTMIFVDKNGNIAKIHAGGMAPSDPLHYNTCVLDFNNTIDSLLKAPVKN